MNYLNIVWLKKLNCILILFNNIQYLGEKCTATAAFLSKFVQICKWEHLSKEVCILFHVSSVLCTRKMYYIVWHPNNATKMHHIHIIRQTPYTMRWNTFWSGILILMHLHFKFKFEVMSPIFKILTTLPKAGILSCKNACAWVSMVSYLKK